MDMFSMGLLVASILVTTFVLAGLLLCKVEIKGVWKLYIMLMLHMLLLVVTIFYKVLKDDPSGKGVYLFMVIVQYPLMAAVVLMLHVYVVEKTLPDTIGGLTFAWVPAGVFIVMTLLWVTSIKTKLFFQLNEAKIMLGGHYAWIAYFVVYLVVMIDLVWLIRCFMEQQIEGHTLTFFCTFLFLPLIAQAFMIICEELFPLYVATSFSFLLVYIFHHQKEVRELRDEISEAEERKTHLVVSQLQPHFMMNSLTTIKYLYAEEPRLAEKAINKFSGYFQTTVESLTKKELVSIEQELSHTQTYLWLEQLRFENMLSVKMQIMDEVEFDLPALTLQPIVENAVKHGVCKKDGGGTVWIAISEEEEHYLITVKDDGVGFDVEILEEEEYQMGGLANVQRRLQNAIYGSMEIESRIGIGTTVEIRIRK